MSANSQKRNRGRKGPKKNRNKRRENSSSIIMPPRLLRTLRYVDSSYVRNNPGNNFLVYSFRVNDLYDPDPAILSGSISGFKEIMGFYTNYRVHHVSVTVHITNNETFSLMYGGVFSQVNLVGLIANRDDAINALEDNFSSKVRILSAKGGVDRGSLQMQLPLSRLLGDKRQYLSDINYSGVGLATPTNPLWFNMIVASPTGSALANGYTNTTTLTFKSEFFGMVNLRA